MPLYPGITPDQALALANAAAGTLKHERGGLESDVSAADGIPRITGGATSILPYVPETAWTPTILGTATAGVGTYTEQTGYYYRLGGMVFISGIVTWTAHTGTGNMDIGGLPIAVARTGVIPLWWTNVTYAAGNGLMGVVISGFPNRILIRNQPATGATGAAVAIDAVASIYFSGLYFA